jgi:ABC-type dipeptide/oligopeptide/nickel transport system permease component
MNRFRFTFYRPLQLIPMLFAITLFSFILIHAIPGDLARTLAGLPPVPRAIVQARVQFGLEQSIFMQYVYFLNNLFHGELGQSIVYRTPVFALVFHRLWPTVFLIVYGAMLSMTVSIGLAFVAARHLGGLVDRLIRAYSAAGLGMPAFWLGIVLIFILSVKLPFFPAAGFGDGIFVQLDHLFLPAWTVALTVSPMLIRGLRASLIREMSADHVDAARSRGLPESAIFRNHVFLNSLIPAVKLLSHSIGWLVGIVVVAERVFAVPGVGSLFIDSVSARDYLVVQAIALLLAAGVVFVKFNLDLAAAAIDPRVKL